MVRGLTLPQMDEVLGITLPASKREEIIATILGEW